MIFDDISVVFSGYNIKNIASFAIDTFIKQYPGLKNKIVYFDDFSTDGTKAHLIKKGIKVITWRKEEIDAYNYLLKKNFFKHQVHMLSVRVSFIINSIFNQLNTKYVFMNDGDVAFYDNGFLERYSMMVDNGYQVIGMPIFAIAVDSKDSPNQEAIEQYKMMAHSEYANVVNQHNIGKVPTIQSVRIGHVHSLYDLEYLKNIGLLGDRLDNDVLSKITGNLFDTNVDFTSRLMRANAKIKFVRDVPIIHWFSCSCEQRGFTKGITDDEEHYVSKSKEYSGDTVFTMNLNDSKEMLKLSFLQISDALCSGYTVDAIANKNEVYKIILKKII